MNLAEENQLKSKIKEIILKATKNNELLKNNNIETLKKKLTDNCIELNQKIRDNKEDIIEDIEKTIDNLIKLKKAIKKQLED